MVSQHTLRKRHAKWRLDRSIHEAVAVARKRSKMCHASFIDLLSTCFEKSHLLVPNRHRNSHQFLRGLCALAENRKVWLRSPFDWIGCTGGGWQQFASLAQHLLAKQSVPAFMTHVWLDERSQTTLQHQRLYKHLALGNHIRGAQLPIKLDRCASEFFYQAPHHLGVNQAVRWSQIRGLGGDNKLATAIAETRLGATFSHEAFWEQLLRMITQQKNLDLSLIGPMVDFLHRHKIVNHRQFRRLVPGSRFQTLVRLVVDWQKRNPNPVLTWKPCGIRGYRFVPPQQHEWSSLQWSIEELTDSLQLIEEGKQLRHCVASYARYCAKGETTIWSMRSIGSLTEQRRLTIQVDAHKRLIRTALGFCNGRPSHEMRQILQNWANREGLRMADHI